MTGVQRLSLIAIVVLAAIVRFYRLDAVPPALFGDEVDTGYQAYSLVKTGRDYFGNLFPVHFESFGDWRVPLYIYLIAPVVGLFGLTAWTVRLPAALFGTLAVLVTYFLARELFHQTSIFTPQTSTAPRNKLKTSEVDHTSPPGWGPGFNPGLPRHWRGFTPGVDSSGLETSHFAVLTSLLLALSPWHIHLSRGAFEAILVTLLFPLGLLFLKRGLEGGRLGYWPAAAVCWGLTPYAYNTPKLFLPLSLVLFAGVFAKQLLFQKRRVLIFLVVLAIVLLPQAKDLVSGPGIARFQAINLFANPEVSERVRLARASGGQIILFEKILHNKATYWLRDFTGNYLRSFSPEFLFITGDPNPRHSLPGRGQLYLMELPFLLVGLYFLLATWIKKRYPWLLFLIGWFFIASIPAALTQGGGHHAIRLIHFLPVIYFVIAYGFISLVGAMAKPAVKKLLVLAGSIVLGVSLFDCLHAYYNHYPKTAASWWNYGYREVFAYLRENEDRFSKIYLSSSREPSLVHAFFHGRFSPDLVQADIVRSTEVVGKYHFLSPDITELGRRGPEPETLYVLNTGELANLGLKIDDNPRFCKISDIYDPGGERLKIIFTHPDSCP